MRRTNRTFFKRALALTGVATFAWACSTDAPDVLAPNFTGGDLPVGYVSLCKFGPEGSTATFQISATGGTLVAGETVTLNATPVGTICQSVPVWRPTDATAVQVTITEVAFSPANLFVTQINVISDIDGIFDYFNPSDPTVTVNANDVAKVAVRFKNDVTPPEIGAAGCTPGFWKQPQHFEFWTAPYTPDTQFGSVFADAFPGMTLLQVLRQGGGDLKALGRHTVAALLNGASADVNYGMDAAGVIAAFNAAYASGDYETQKNIFAEGNERGCTAKD